MLILRSLLAVQRAMMNDKHCVEMCALPPPCPCCNCLRLLHVTCDGSV